MAVVLLQDLKATSAAEIASFVSANPISGTVPSSPFVAGSTERISTVKRADDASLTRHVYCCTVLSVNPFPVNVSLQFDEGIVLQTKLATNGHEKSSLRDSGLQRAYRFIACNCTSHSFQVYQAEHKRSVWMSSAQFRWTTLSFEGKSEGRGGTQHDLCVRRAGVHKCSSSRRWVVIDVSRCAVPAAIVLFILCLAV